MPMFHLSPCDFMSISFTHHSPHLTSTSSFLVLYKRGWDIPELTDFVADGQSTRNQADALAVVTRLRRRRQQAQEHTEPETLSDRNLAELTQSPNKVETHYAFNFDDFIFAPAGPSKPLSAETRGPPSTPAHYQGNRPDVLNVTPQELCRLQDNDESLSGQRMRADGAPGAAMGEKFFHENVLIYRCYSPPGSDNNVYRITQLVLPMQLCPVVLKLAHDIPLAGHLSRKKTTDRIIQRFYWPGVFWDIQNLHWVSKVVSKGHWKHPWSHSLSLVSHFDELQWTSLGLYPVAVWVSGTYW